MNCSKKGHEFCLVNKRTCLKNSYEIGPGINGNKAASPMSGLWASRGPQTNFKQPAAHLLKYTTCGLPHSIGLSS